MIDKSYLARLMLEWEQKKRKLEELEAAITDTVLQLEESQEVGNVKATYYSGRKRYDYEIACGDDPDPYLVKQFTESKVNWRKLALDGIGLSKDEIPFTKSDPSVSLRITD